MGEPIRSLLVADDDAVLLKAFSSSLSRLGISPYTAPDRAGAMRLARKHRPDAAIVDLQLGCDNGLELLRDLKAEHAALRVVLLSGHASLPVAVDAMKLGAFHVLQKPCTLRQILRHLDSSDPAESTRVVDTLSAERALWEHMHQVLAECGGNKSEAARRLKKPRSWLHRQLSRPAPKD